ncbi:MAG TPA: diheme cytochrome c-553 [Saprospiraceae bacterium]|nr:diheme cytochrome c-553 [Saprospiraceae bacterium]
MKNLLIFGCLFLLGIFFLACQPENKTGPTATDQAAVASAGMSKADSVKRGEYLVTTMGCNDCHTPKTMTNQGSMPDPARLLSGHTASEVLPKMPNKSVYAPGQWILINSSLTSFTGPWGTSFAANLTPHETGIGNWTLENFDRALRIGKHLGAENGRPILPPMPWPNLVNLTKEDLANMWQYLRSLKPVENKVPNPLPPA